MTYLKESNVNKCLDILKDFVEDASARDKGMARLALRHLMTITAGTGGSTPDSWCAGRPRAEGSPEPVNG